ncbi:type II toxin-antitoxin system PemK/MazF family toxin [Streptomyces sp. NEAU-W12]|nr:type II toxin-antitoxin system PemK/MazF family toxin [Streptomyces sp. NEAU-W12]MCX2925396.1 type II toxin-antitoxin system PemK/MazF family toxin [Streptomyces sp. NEAU-W12]
MDLDLDLEPVRGSETDKVRPAVIASDNAANESVVRNDRGVVTVAPLTSDTSRILMFQVLLRSEESRLPKDSEVRCGQVRAIAPKRLLHRAGAVPRQRMIGIGVALRRHPAL